MNGANWQNPRFARNENVQLTATFDKRTDARAESARVQAPCHKTARFMRENRASFL